MKKIIPVLMLAFLLSCEEETQLPCDDGKPCRLCGVTDPEINLPWFKALTEEINASWAAQHTYIQQGFYVTNVAQGSHLEIPVFIIGSCYPQCTWGIPVYDCDGDLICHLGSTNLECLNGFVTIGEVIWKSSQNGCVFQ